MSIREHLDGRAKHIEDQQLARAEELKDATATAKLLGYKRITWAVLRKLGYDIERLGFRDRRND